MKGLKTDIRRALGLPEKEGASDYGVFVIEDNGTSKECSIRISNHNANAGNYEGKESDTNISIKMRSRVNKNTFKPHKDIELMEYTYFDYLLMNVEQPIQKIILSIIEYLSNGIYNDKTGVALQNTSPQQVNNDTENNQELKENRNMNKKQVIRLNENQLKQIVMESVKEVLNNEHFPSSGEHPDIYTSDTKQGNKYQIRYGSDYGYKKDSSLLKNGLRNPNAKRTEWMWIKDMVNHANDLFTEYHLYDEEAYEAIEKLYTLLKQGVSESDAIDKVGDMFYRDEN